MSAWHWIERLRRSCVLVAKCQVRVDYWDKICYEVFLCGMGEQVMSQVYQNLLCLNPDLVGMAKQQCAPEVMVASILTNYLIWSLKVLAGLIIKSSKILVLFWYKFYPLLAGVIFMPGFSKKNSEEFFLKLILDLFHNFTIKIVFWTMQPRFFQNAQTFFLLWVILFKWSQLGILSTCMKLKLTIFINSSKDLLTAVHNSTGW